MDNYPEQTFARLLKMKKSAFFFYISFFILVLLMGCSSDRSKDSDTKNKKEDKSGKKIMLLEKKISELSLKIDLIQKSTAKTIPAYFIIILFINIIISVFIGHVYKKQMLALSSKTKNKKTSTKTPINKSSEKSATVRKKAVKTPGKVKK